jgi:thiol-disulfide isomerase/thioredoxin
VSKRTVDLSQHLGHWVFIDFWASWCGPCMNELPNLLKSTADLRRDGRLEIFSVSLDDDETSPALGKVIRENKLSYPVVYDGGGWSAVSAKEWGINSIPATFLVDPQGNVVATNLRGEALRPALDFFLNYPGQYVPVGVRTSAAKNQDGSVALQLELSSPERKPLNYRVDYYHQRYTYAADDPDHTGRPVNVEYVETNADGPEEEGTMQFASGFGEGVETLQIPAVENTQRMMYSVTVQLPGTESLLGGAGIWVTTRGRVNLEEPKLAPAG